MNRKRKKRKAHAFYNLLFSPSFPHTYTHSHCIHILPRKKQVVGREYLLDSPAGVSSIFLTPFFQLQSLRIGLHFTRILFFTLNLKADEFTVCTQTLICNCEYTLQQLPILLQPPPSFPLPSLPAVEIRGVKRLGWKEEAAVVLAATSTKTCIE